MTRFDIYLMRINDGDIAAVEEAARDTFITRTQYIELYRVARLVARRYC